MDRAQYTAADRHSPLKALASRRKHIRANGIASLCTMFEPLVKMQARSYRQHVFGADLEDLEQVARLGLLHACNSFVVVAKKKKWNNGAFARYAMWCVRNALSKYVETLGNPVRAPAWMVRRLPKLKRLTIVMGHELLREPTRDEIAARMKLPVTAIESMLLYAEGPRPLPEAISGAGSKLPNPAKLWSNAHIRKLRASVGQR